MISPREAGVGAPRRGTELDPAQQACQGHPGARLGRGWSLWEAAEEEERLGAEGTASSRARRERGPLEGVTGQGGRLPESMCGLHAVC